MTPPVFFATVGGAEPGGVLLVTGDEGRHAADVRRMRVGEAIDLTDGAGVMVSGVVAEVRRGELSVEVRQRRDLPEPSPVLTVVQALAKGGRDELAVEAMTEVGVDRVVGWEASRNVAHWKDRTEARWVAAARSATKQSRRAWCPTVSGPAATAEVAAMCTRADLALVLHESAESSLSALSFAAAKQIVVVVGPEGGIAPDELSAFAAAGGQVVRLGETVLRSSTAGVAALSVICAATRWV